MHRLIDDISLFPSPSTPDLGCFLRRKHGVQVDEWARNVHVDLNPSVDFQPRHHQVYYRVVCGHASYFQRALVYMRSDLSIPGPVLAAFPPDDVLGGDYTPRPGDWRRFPTQTGQRFYVFLGQHRPPDATEWRADGLVGHGYDIYENGTLSTVRYDDTGGDRDLDDFVLEVAVVGRRSWRDLVQARDQAEATEAAAEPLRRALRERVVEIEPD
jgi:hypothetical protein